MHTIQDIQQTLARLSPEDRQDIAHWLRIQSLKQADTVDRVEEPKATYGAARQPTLLTKDEYLELETYDDVPHEYIAGEIFAMADPTLRHEAIVANVFGTLYTHLRGGPCRAHTSSVRLNLRIDTADIFYHPDVMVSCGTLDLDSKFLRTATLVVEVLSPSTERIDRREKLLSYQQVPGLEEYVLVAQRKQEITVYRRSENWEPGVLAAPGDILQLQSVDLALPLLQIYEGVF